MAPNTDDADLVVIALGASAGGVDALSTVIAGLPADLPAAVCVVLHLAPESKSVLPHILTVAGQLPAHHPTDQEPLRAGRVYVGPADRHLVVERGSVRLTLEPRENGLRPSVDRLFRSAAQAYGPRAVGVVLSGTLDDGTAGLISIKLHGGVAVVQDPEEAVFPSMPASAARFADPDYVMPLEKIPALLEAIVAERLATPPLAAVFDAAGRAVDEDANPADASAAAQSGEPSELTCPECGGTLWAGEEGELLRFRCRVGHAFSTESLLSGQRQALEAALWAAVVALEERADLTRRLAERVRGGDEPHRGTRFAREARDARERAAVVRDAILHLQLPLDGDEEMDTDG